jgi:hypothetical protein
MGRDPSHRRARGLGGRLDRPPGWADSLTAGRSRSDKETDRDAFGKVMLLATVLLVPLLLAAHAILTVTGSRFGWWSAPVFGPLLAWLLASAVMSRVLRPVKLNGLRWKARLTLAAPFGLVFWACWSLWAGPAAQAWKSAHGGFGADPGNGPHYPLHAVLAASPVLLGVLAFLALAVGMLLTPNVRGQGRAAPRPPAGPEPVRAPLLGEGGSR